MADSDSESNSAPAPLPLSSRRTRASKTQSDTFQLAPPAWADIASWIAEEWAGLTASTTTSGFKRIDLLDDTRASALPAQTLLDDVSALLAAMPRLVLASRANATVSSDDDLHTTDEESEANSSDSELE